MGARGGGHTREDEADEVSRDLEGYDPPRVRHFNPCGLSESWVIDNCLNLFF